VNKKERKALYDLEYRKKNRERKAQTDRKYAIENRVKIAMYHKKHYRDNIERYRKNIKAWKEKNKQHYLKLLGSWEGFIPKETTCQVCGKTIYFNVRNHNLAIHFDHRRGNEVIMGSPALWLRGNRRTPEKEVIWKSCDFGMLCQNCNRMIPTNNRKEFLLKALEYIKL
jgi:5-methylcytosine-specific restriction endonuclease McrA